MATDNIKQGDGWCGLYMSHIGPPLVIYKIDKCKPILDENEIILIKNSDDTELWLNSSGRYGYLRGSILERDYDQVKSRLTRDDFYELRKIVDRKLEKLEKILEEKLQ